jgi:hypothetical protein
MHINDLGGAVVHLTKVGGMPSLSYSLAGKLYVSKSGWLLLSVPNALVRGAFDALDEPGVELPMNSDGLLNAHISVMRPEEVQQLGGADKVTERGHSFRYTLGPVEEVVPSGWKEMSKVWYIRVNSPALQDLRRSYGLSPRPRDNDFAFHITIGRRRKSVLYHNDLRKGAQDATQTDSPSRQESTAQGTDGGTDGGRQEVQPVRREASPAGRGSSTGEGDRRCQEGTPAAAIAHAKRSAAASPATLGLGSSPDGAAAPFSAVNLLSELTKRAGDGVGGSGGSPAGDRSGTAAGSPGSGAAGCGRAGAAGVVRPARRVGSIFLCRPETLP